MGCWGRWSVCILLLSFCALAQSDQRKPVLNERLTVQAIHFVAVEDGYRVSFKEKAALLLAATDMLPCLTASQRLNKPVDVQFEAFSLRVLRCQPAPQLPATN